jgi:SPP1 gp7 family putative phage head morphogenesis protein
MNIKIATEKEFMNIWFVTGKDPDGNYIRQIMIGGPSDAYRSYLARKQKEIADFMPQEQNLNICNNFEQKNSATPSAIPHLLQNDISFVQNSQTSIFSSMSQNPPRIYRWLTIDDEKVRLEHLARQGKIFGWNSADTRPGEEYNCRCYAEFIDKNGNPTGEYGRMSKEGHFEPCDKNGVPLSQKQWKELDAKQKEQRKQEELDKFKNSDKLKENIKEAQKMKNESRFERYKWMYRNFQTGGKYDIKNGDPAKEHAGNFNYGAMGAAAGLSDVELKAGAGFQQVKDGTSSPTFFYPQSWSYGDDPVDQKYITDGINWYNKNY